MLLVIRCCNAQAKNRYFMAHIEIEKVLGIKQWNYVRLLKARYQSQLIILPLLYNQFEQFGNFCTV